MANEEIYLRFILRRAEMNLNTSMTWATECISELKGEQTDPS